ncbi:unnamed protein product [Pleuronectes platessa]|uniref:Uncharacterized protein n=1 Tax=Pleuronectes platessa TaxID=8262 RepID=A0A9N7TU81_PLEPL|nr:unnamed protein product [Pleuronectes platessa]
MDDIKLIIEVEKLITAEVCDIISNARRFGVATASGVTSQAPARQGLAPPRFGVASASGVNPASDSHSDYNCEYDNIALRSVAPPPASRTLSERHSESRARSRGAASPRERALTD